MIFNLILLVLSLGLLFTIISGAPYLPTDEKSIAEMLALANIAPGQHVADLGSGDGRILMAFARVGAVADGYELNPLLVWLSRWRIRRAKLRDRCSVYQKSFWKADLSQYDIIVVFGITRIMPKLEAKLRQELRPGTLILSHVFQFPTLPLLAERPLVRLYTIDRNGIS